jgi:hypothetical protein
MMRRLKAVSKFAVILSGAKNLETVSKRDFMVAEFAKIRPVNDDFRILANSATVLKLLLA